MSEPSHTAADQADAHIAALRLQLQELRRASVCIIDKSNAFQGGVDRLEQAMADAVSPVPPARLGVGLYDLNRQAAELRAILTKQGGLRDAFEARQAQRLAQQFAGAGVQQILNTLHPMLSAESVDMIRRETAIGLMVVWLVGSEEIVSDVLDEIAGRVAEFREDDA